MVGSISELKGLLIKANTRQGFEAKLAEGLILSTSVVFILDTHEIWTQGEYFPCPYSKEEIDTTIESINNSIDELNDFYTGLLSQLQKYQNDTNALIAQKEQSATQALSLEVARASGEEAKLKTSIDNVANIVAQESERAVAAENELRNSKYQVPTGGIPKTDLDDSVQSSLNKADTALQEHQPLDAYAKNADLTSHTSNTSNPHAVTKAQVGLSNVDNTSDVNKPISTATQTALDSKVDKVSGKGLSTNDYTTTEKNKLAGIANSANNYSHPTYTAHTGVPIDNAAPDFGGTFYVSQPISDGTGHITAINTRTVTIPSSVATTSKNGLMSIKDKDKLDGIASGATKVIVDSALSDTSTNPVQNKLIKAALDELNIKLSWKLID